MSPAKWPNLPRSFDKPLLFIVCLLPAAWLVYRALSNNLGANPVEELSHRSGDWTLRFLLITLAVTPLHRKFQLPRLVALRRMLGLYAFFYASMHFLIYLVLDRSLLMSEILKDIGKRPYITVGFTALVLLIPLAATSNRYMIKRLGRNWKRLHRLVYLIAIGGVIHYMWLVKSDLTEPLIYLIILGILFALRIPMWRQQWVASASR
jgi:sulfoxide reductase heme-binding subunit YedZ